MMNPIKKAKSMANSIERFIITYSVANEVLDTYDRVLASNGASHTDKELMVDQVEDYAIYMSLCAVRETMENISNSEVLLNTVALSLKRPQIEQNVSYLVTQYALNSNREVVV